MKFRRGVESHTERRLRWSSEELQAQEVATSHRNCHATPGGARVIKTRIRWLRSRETAHYNAEKWTRGMTEFNYPGRRTRSNTYIHTPRLPQNFTPLSWYMLHYWIHKFTLHDHTETEITHFLSVSIQICTRFYNFNHSVSLSTI